MAEFEKFNFKEFLPDEALTRLQHRFLPHHVNPQLHRVRSLYQDELALPPKPDEGNVLAAALPHILRIIPEETLYRTGVAVLSRSNPQSQFERSEAVYAAAVICADRLFKDSGLSYTDVQTMMRTFLMRRFDRNEKPEKHLSTISGLPPADIPPPVGLNMAEFDNFNALFRLAFVFFPQVDNHAFVTHKAAVTIYKTQGGSPDVALLEDAAQMARFFNTGKMPQEIFGFLAPHEQRRVFPKLRQEVLVAGDGHLARRLGLHLDTLINESPYDAATTEAEALKIARHLFRPVPMARQASDDGQMFPMLKIATVLGALDGLERLMGKLKFARVANLRSDTFRTMAAKLQHTPGMH